MLKNLKIQRKLALGFAVMILFMAVMGLTRIFHEPKIPGHG